MNKSYAFAFIPEAAATISFLKDNFSTGFSHGVSFRFPSKIKLTSFSTCSSGEWHVTPNRASKGEEK